MFYIYCPFVNVLTFLIGYNVDHQIELFLSASDHVIDEYTAMFSISHGNLLFDLARYTLQNVEEYLREITRDVQRMKDEVVVSKMWQPW